eukprot:IDg4357t1
MQLLLNELFSITVIMSAGTTTSVRRINFFTRPKLPSQTFLVCPGIKNLNSTLLSLFVITNHTRNQSTKRFLFCPAQLSAESRNVFPRPLLSLSRFIVGRAWIPPSRRIYHWASDPPEGQKYTPDLCYCCEPH